MTNKPEITIHPPARAHIKELPGKFGLQQDNFNDYSFQTMYHLYYKKNEKNHREITYIGKVKILRKNQTEKDGLQITKSFTKLSKDFCSVGASLDYYQRLNQIPPTDRKMITGILNDVVAKPKLQLSFSSEPGWSISLFRDNPEWQIFLADAATLFNGNFSTVAQLTQAFTFQPAGDSNELTFDFSAPTPEYSGFKFRKLGPSNKKTLLPERVVVLIGRNGSGKSTLLSRIAHLAYASPEERTSDRLIQMGSLEPAGIGFFRVITVSYSAFDSFRVPGTAQKSVSQTLKDIDSGDGRFVYCGLRDIVEEAKDSVKSTFNTTPYKYNETKDIEINNERSPTTKLKSIEKLADEFASLIKKIKKEKKEPLLSAAMAPLLTDPSFSDISEDDNIFKNKVRENFLSWSTGHKIVLHVIASLVAHSTYKSLILFDEPEMHLHPPLVAALMHAIRIILEETSAFCIIATHSPVLLQETLAKHVKIIERFNNALLISTPSRETFGENIGNLTYSAFGLTSSATDFHKILDLLVAGNADLEDIDELFTPGLSAQALSYVISKLAEKRLKK